VARIRRPQPGRTGQPLVHVLADRRRPIDLSRIIKINKPFTRVYYNLQEIGRPNFDGVLGDFI
jgi:hypothetical protein